jgi:ATP-dependent Clp protease adapter protein ClpS
MMNQQIIIYFILAIPFFFMPSCSALVTRQPSIILSKQTTQLAAMVPQPQATTKAKNAEKRKPLNDKSFIDEEGWEIIIYDNNVHYDYQVAELLVKVVNLSEVESFRAMRSAEDSGSARIGQYNFELAEFYTSSLKDYGLTCDMVPLDFQ